MENFFKNYSRYFNGYAIAGNGITDKATKCAGIYYSAEWLRDSSGKP